MPYSPKGYTDKASVEDYLLIDIDPQFDEKVDEWISAAEKIIDQETNRDFTPGTEGTGSERLFDGDGTSILQIGEALAVNSVTLSPEGTPLDEDQYFLYPANATVKTSIRMRYLTFPVGLQNIVIDADWGIEQVPADIRHAATVLVAGIINAAWPEQGGTRIASMSVGRYSVSYTNESQKNDLNAIQDILDRNKRYVM